MNHGALKTLGVVRVVVLYVFWPPFLQGTERIERKAQNVVILWGRILLLKRKLHFLLIPLHFDIHLLSGLSRKGLARAGWVP